MSCEQTVKSYEACAESFFELLLHDYDFQFLIYDNLLSFQERWREKEIGWDESPYGDAFDTLWEWDSEGVYHDIRNCVSRYIVHKQKGKGAVS